MTLVAALPGPLRAAPTPIDSTLARMPRGPREFARGYGPLVPDPNGVLDLPAGFHYTILSSGVLASDLPRESRFARVWANGDSVPPQFDGMAAFAGPGGTTILVRNHEMNPWDRPMVDPARRRPYDVQGWGGTSTLWVSPDLRVTKEFASLSGTLRNCAGGATPWGSWLTCEECVYLPGAPDPRNADRTPDVRQRHGYVYEVDAHATDLVEASPIKPMGRFRHEAVAIDPHTGFAYLTEDRPDGLLYRFRPAVLAAGRRPASLHVGDYAKGGVLEALRVVGRPGLVTTNKPAPAAVRVGEPMRVDWVRIANVDPDDDDERDPEDPNPEPSKRRLRPSVTSTRAQGFALGAAQFSRGEGMAVEAGAIWFSGTNGGPAGLGQVWKLDPARGTLTLVVETDSQARLDGPDNLCAAPNGDVVVCEDGLQDNFIVGITRDGRCYHLARNAHLLKREFAGACFSPDGRTLFVNIQQPALTLAIRGPWEKRQR